MGRLRTRQILADVLDNLFNLESRLGRTIVGLTQNPGRVARDYVDGQRIRFVSPFRYCLATLALFFLIATLLGQAPLDATGIKISTSSTPGSATTGWTAGAVRDILGRHLMTIFLSSMPVLGLVLRLLFRRSGRNYAETMAFVFFTVGHAFLLSLLLLPLSTIWSDARDLRLLLVFGLLAYGARTFFASGAFAAAAKVLLGYVAYGLAMIAIGLIAVLLAMLLTNPS
ncbi:MAG: DUF3667 domain-containing protein [Planctomycetes bacterium]|nr:DUF3667 domain-containing protein [Planctomycetota bacterium]